MMWCSSLCDAIYSVSVVVGRKGLNGARLSEHTLHRRKRNQDLRRTERSPSANDYIRRFSLDGLNQR